MSRSVERLLCVPALLGAFAIAGCGSSAGDPPPLPELTFQPPSEAPTAVVSSPGCKALAAGDEDRVRIRRNAVEPPTAPVPFFARRAGALPADGEPIVAGVPLPAGSRCLHHWATDEPIADPLPLASKLAAAFPGTGLWPVLWEATWEDPDSYMNATGDPAAAARLDPESIMRGVWAGYGSDRHPFPGLATGSGGVGTGATAADPFGTLARSLPFDEWPEAGWVLMLVPVNRPADLISVLGPWVTETMTGDLLTGDDALTAILRSWEERFGAVPVTIGPGTLGLVVDAPPRNRDQALRLAYEQHAFAPEDGELHGPEDLPRLAERLRAGEPGSALRTRDFWQFAWPD